MIQAKVIADSKSPQGKRLTTMVVTFPRFILAELNTHRMFSRNSASSRAIPFEKMVKSVQENPFIPIAWQKDHKGMQGTEYFKPDETFTSENPMDRFANGITDKDSPTKIIVDRLKAEWLWGRDMAVQTAKNLHNMGVHYHPDGNISKLTGEGVGLTKQLCNRLLEPFLWHTIILTGTEFENFFALRAHPMAEIHLQNLAYKMLDAMNNSTPNELKEGEWHIPCGEDIIIDTPSGNGKMKLGQYRSKEELDSVIKIATARCAQISYMKFGSDDYADLIDLHDSLVIRPYEGKRGIRTIEDPIHASPASHCAQAMTLEEYTDFCKGIRSTKTNQSWKNNPNLGWCHNLRGFKSYRSMLSNENSTDSRLIKK